MRLYVKLLAIILLAAAVQRYVLAGSELSDLWFGMRCSFAYTTHDDRLLKRLVLEARQHEQAKYHMNAAGG